MDPLIKSRVIFESRRRRPAVLLAAALFALVCALCPEGACADDDRNAPHPHKHFTVSLQAGPDGWLQDDQGRLHSAIVQEVPFGGDTAPVEAVASEHFHFSRWRGDVDASSPKLTLYGITRNISVTADFEIDAYRLRFFGGGLGGVEVDGRIYEVYEAVVPWSAGSKTVTAVPDNPEFFLGWSGPGGFVSSDPSIRVTDVRSSGDYSYALPMLPGCSVDPPPKRFTDAAGFRLEEFHALNVGVEDGHLVLKTGNRAINPERIVLPFRQEVAVYFLYEGVGQTRMDFGWLLLDPHTGEPSGEWNEIYRDINDHNYAWNSGNGVLDISAENCADRFGDRNGDGRVDALDNREVIGTFEAGTEIVFYLELDEKNYDPDYDFGRSDEPVIFYTKTRWNKGVYRSYLGHPGHSCDRTRTGDTFEKIYHLGQVNTTEGRCLQESAWMTAEAIERAAGLFDLHFAADDSSTLSISWDARFPAVMVGAPADKPNAWILGWENIPGGGDTDHNDLVFIVERKSGGAAQSASALEPAEPDAYFTAANFQIYEYQPGGFCRGRTTLDYFISARDGIEGSWIKINDWDRIQAFTVAADGSPQVEEEPLGPDGWQPGDPEYTVRSRRIDLASLGQTGRELVWKVELVSGHEACVPRVIDAVLSGDTAVNGRFSRAAPVVQANLIYAAEYETPDWNWPEKAYRGHVTAARIFAVDDPERTLEGDTTLWDAGAVLSPADNASRVRIINDRNIYFPEITVNHVVEETLRDEADGRLEGDNTRRSFSGALSHRPVTATTLRIYAGAETFNDEFSDALTGSLNGRGVIDRFTGRWEVTFQQAPSEGLPIRADYAYYQTSPTLRRFTPENVTGEMLALSDAVVHPEGYVHDFNRDGVFDEADTQWLVQWVRGFRDPDRNLARRWLLGPVDHSTPALMIPPGYPLWYFGSAVDPAERESYRQFREALQDRPAVLFVGSRSGMLHAFDAGTFRHGDNPATAGVEENRGYFQWRSKSSESPEYCRREYLHKDLCPDYGTGAELWAFIPANLLPRLKNNFLRADDQSFVDASPALADAFVDTDGDGVADAWRTLLLAAEGNGGDTVFCLDVTDPLAPRFLWEFAAPELFRSRSSPAVCRIGRIQGESGPLWAAFFVTGRSGRRDSFPAVYMIDVSNGRLLRRIVLDSAADRNGNGFAETGEIAYGQGGIPSGQPALVDSDANGYVDRFYVASDRGIVYKVNLPDRTERTADRLLADIEVCSAALNQDFNADGIEIPIPWRWQPIYGSPAVTVEHQPAEGGGLQHRVRVFFGTGDSPYYDENIDGADTRYHFFAYLDTAPKGGCAPGDHRLDWFTELETGHRVFASAFAAAGQVYFGTAAADTEDPCEGHAVPDADAGKIYAFDLEGTLLLQQQVGDVLITPLVEDRHLYFRTMEGLQSLGDGRYNNRVLLRAVPGFRVQAWQQVD